MECLSYCIANSIDLTLLDNHFKANFQDYQVVKSRGVLKLSAPSDKNHMLFVFKNGTIVTWGLKRYQVKSYLQTIQLFADRPIPFLVRDEYSYQIGDKTAIEPHGFFDVDCFTLGEDNEELKLSLSYGFSQSVKLQYFEKVIETLIDKYSPLIQKLSNKGKMPISRNKIRQIIGEILHAKSEMNLISNFLYHPKYFWQHPNMQEYFIMLEHYLHIQRRVNALNHRLDTLNEIFDMFNSYLENRHAHILEIIIIILIMIEIIFAAVNSRVFH